MNTTKSSSQRYTQERMVGSHKQVFDSVTGQWVWVSMALLELFSRDEASSPETTVLDSDSSS